MPFWDVRRENTMTSTSLSALIASPPSKTFLDPEASRLKKISFLFDSSSLMYGLDTLTFTRSHSTPKEVAFNRSRAEKRSGIPRMASCPGASPTAEFVVSRLRSRFSVT